MNGKKLNPSQLNARRKEAVTLRLQKKSLNEIQQQTGLSHPTIIAAYHNFLAGGWEAVNLKHRGRPAPAAAFDHQRCIQFLLNNPPQAADKTQHLWSNATVRRWIEATLGIQLSIKSVDRYLEKWGFAPPDPVMGLASPKAWLARHCPAAVQHSPRRRILIGGLCTAQPANNKHPASGSVIYARDLRGKLYWLASAQHASSDLILDFLQRLLQQFSDALALVFNSYPLDRYLNIQTWLHAQPRVQLLTPEPDNRTATTPLIVPPNPRKTLPTAAGYDQSEVRQTMSLTHLQRLEAESIQIMREVVSAVENPVMLYSIGKDSAVMLHLAMKAFYPSKPPFPLLHVDTRWKFRDMYTFRDQLVKDLSMELIAYTNPEGLEKGINPFTHGSALHTHIMKTEALKQALDKFGFDAAFGGARRDEEKSRAKERIFSFRSADHHWDPKNQRPELWKHYNAKKSRAESIRVFPLSNWTELDIWQYIYLENIPIVPLYLAAERPVVERDGMLIMVDDERIPMNNGEVPMMKKVRFRTLGCYPLTGAIESDADTLPSVIQEMLLTRTSERQGRLIDHDATASMEKKKQEGYF